MVTAPNNRKIWITATSDPDTPISEAIKAISEAPAGDDDKIA